MLLQFSLVKWLDKRFYKFQIKVYKTETLNQHSLDITSHEFVSLQIYCSMTIQLILFKIKKEQPTKQFYTSRNHSSVYFSSKCTSCESVSSNIFQNPKTNQYKQMNIRSEIFVVSLHFNEYFFYFTPVKSHFLMKSILNKISVLFCIYTELTQQSNKPIVSKIE